MATPAHVQLGLVIADMERHKTLFNADVIGNDVLDLAAEVAYDRFDRGIDPDGSPWPELSQAYADWKSRHALSVQMGVLEGDMAGDLDEFKGERTVNQTEATSIYGTNDVARTHAEWFEEGDPVRHRPPRAFTAMSFEAVLKIDDALDRYHESNL